MYYLTDLRKPQNHIKMWKDGHYIILEKDIEKGKKYYKYDLITNTFQRANIYKYYTKHSPQKTKYMTAWIKDCQLVTNDEKFARMFWWTKTNPNLAKFSSNIRYIEHFGDNYTKMFEQIDILDIKIQEIENILQKSQNNSPMLTHLYPNLLHEILTDKQRFKNIKKVERYFGRQLTLDELYYFGKMPTSKIDIFLKLWSYATTEAYQHLFTYQNGFHRDENIFIDEDGYVNDAYSYKRQNLMETILTFNINVDRFVEYLNTIFHIEKVTLDDIIDNYHYRDYLNMQREIHHGRLSKVIKYPINFMTAFHRTKKQYDILKQSIDKLKFLEEMEKAQKLDYLNKKYSIKVAQTPNEIEEEGDKLHHCVRSYIKPMSEGKTSIFLMRKIEDLKKPFVTVEVKNGKLTQAYGAYDKKPTEDALEFLRKWAKNNNLELTWKWK